MKKFLFLILSLIWSHFCTSQVKEGTFDEIINSIDDNYGILDTTWGDLNLDSLSDFILVLKHKNELKLSNYPDTPFYRPLLIYISTENLRFKNLTSNSKAVYCIDCGGVMGDPFLRVIIKNSYFTIEHYGGSAWRWTRFVTFKYSKDKNNWFLHKDGGDSFHVNSLEDVKTSILTQNDFGIVKFDSFDIFKEYE